MTCNPTRAARWRRSRTTGSLFLLEAGHRQTLGTVFHRADGTYGWKAGSVASVDECHYATEEQAIERLFQALGM